MHDYDNKGNEKQLKENSSNLESELAFCCSTAATYTYNMMPYRVVRCTSIKTFNKIILKGKQNKTKLILQWALDFL